MNTGEAARVKLDILCRDSFSPECLEVTCIEVDPDDYEEYSRDKRAIYTRFPYLTAEEKETMRIGTCPACQELIL